MSRNGRGRRSQSCLLAPQWRASRAPSRDRRPPLSGNRPTTPSTRRDRRATERRERFEVDREQRRKTSDSGGGSSFINTRTMTIAGIVIGVLIVAFVAFGQLGNKATGKLKDPGFAYPAAIVDGQHLGSASAPVTLEVFEDYQCPVCARYSLDVEPSLVNSYVAPGQLRIQHNDVAILGRGGPDDESKIAATGAFCANEQGVYWPYAHWIYNNQDGENQGGFQRDRVTQIAVAAGAEQAAFATCLDGDAALAAVTQQTTAAVDLGINSTPTMRLNGGPLMVGLKSAAELGTLIDAALAKASGAPSVSPDASASPVMSPVASASTTP